MFRPNIGKITRTAGCDGGNYIAKLKKQKEIKNPRLPFSISQQRPQGINTPSAKAKPYDEKVSFRGAGFSLNEINYAAILICRGSKIGTVRYLGSY